MVRSLASGCPHQEVTSPKVLPDPASLRPLAAGPSADSASLHPLAAGPSAGLAVAFPGTWPPWAIWSIPGQFPGLDAEPVACESWLPSEKQHKRLLVLGDSED